MKADITKDNSILWLIRQLVSLDGLWNGASVVVVLLPKRTFLHANPHGERQNRAMLLGQLRKLLPSAPKKKPTEKSKESTDRQTSHLFLVFTGSGSFKASGGSL